MNKKNIVRKFFYKHRYLHLLVMPCIVYFFVFRYLPMYGNIIAFKDYKGIGGFWGIINAEWVGLKYFKMFFSSYYFTRLLGNTLIISLLRLVFAFPAPIILSILINEIRATWFKRTVQTISYMPHFLSWVVTAGLIATLLSPTSGPVNAILERIGLQRVFFIGDPKYFRSVLVISDIWKNVGWGTIVYLAAICGLGNEIMEAATVDGANKWHKIMHITLPGIKEIIAILFILSVGRILDENFEQIFNLYSEAVFNVSDVFETYVYRRGIRGGDFSYSSAVNLFKSVASLLLVLGSNKIAKKLGSYGLW